MQFIRYFVHAGTVNIVMEYAPHGTLRNILLKGRLNKDLLTDYFCDMLMGLEYLHIRHVIHRDLKPENLLVGSGNRILIADFGISAVHNPAGIKQNDRAGTFFYSAPEVLMGVDKCDFKLDVWSLGCVLYEMCVGHNPFVQANSPQDLMYLMKVLTHPKINCTLINHTHGPVLANICQHMLIHDQRNRYSLANIICFDPALTVRYYNQYFEYQY